MRLEGKVAVVTGGGAGIGRGIVRCMAREGADIAIPDIQDANAQAVVKEVLGMGRKAIAMHCDVTRSADVQAAVERIKRELGRIDILVNNAGMASAPGMPFTNNSEEDWDRVFAVNLKSCYLAMKHVIPVMEQQGGGSIINISSVASIRFMGVPYATYYATKAAMNHLTRTTAAQYAPKKIRVNAILPGLMKTPMVERSASLARSYADGDVEAMWRARLERFEDVLNETTRRESE